jgi:5'(3')-deoxyribonucleotidase
MSNRPILLLDMDLTIAATYDLLVARLNQEYGLDLDETNPSQYFEDHKIKDLRIERGAVDAIFSTNSFFLNLKPIYGAKTAIVRLGKYFDIHIVTRPWHQAEHPYLDKLNWIREHFPQLENKFIATGSKEIVYGDILVDDHMPFCKAWKQFWYSKGHWPKVASLKYSWTDELIVDIVGRNWTELSNKILKV